jgi:hypothetical protein
MKKTTKVLLMAAVFGLLAIRIGLLSSGPAPAQTSSAPVTVVNGAANPVPVSGNVTASQAAPWLVRAVQASPWRVANPLNAATLGSTYRAGCGQCRS